MWAWEFTAPSRVLRSSDGLCFLVILGPSANPEPAESDGDGRARWRGTEARPGHPALQTKMRCRHHAGLSR